MTRIAFIGESAPRPGRSDTCTPSSIASVTLSRRIAKSSNPADQANAAALLGALRTADGASVGTVSGDTVSFSPASQTSDACTGFIDVVDPVPGSREVSRSLRLTVRTGSGLVTGSLKLVCAPTFP